MSVYENFSSIKDVSSKENRSEENFEDVDFELRFLNYEGSEEDLEGFMRKLNSLTESELNTSVLDILKHLMSQKIEAKNHDAVLLDVLIDINFTKDELDSFRSTMDLMNGLAIEDSNSIVNDVYEFLNDTTYKSFAKKLCEVLKSKDNEYISMFGNNGIDNVVKVKNTQDFKKYLLSLGFLVLYKFFF